MNDKAPSDSRRGKRILIVLAAMFVAPVIASYLAYYVVEPRGRTNYGTLIEPQRPTAGLGLADAQARPARLADFAGRWLIVAVDEGGCAARCTQQLALMRQLRLATGKDRDRIERLLLVTGDAQPGAEAMAPFEGTVVLRARAQDLRALLPVDQGATIFEHLYLVDPLGNLMMRYPGSPDGTRIRKDLERLLRVSQVG